MVQVYLVKRYLKKRQRNGQREYRWALRWESADGWKCESTGTADKTRAETLRQAKWDELNDRAPPRAEQTSPLPESEVFKASWQQCHEAIERAMAADNLRPKYIEEALLTFDVLRRMFSDVAMPADFTPAMAQDYKRRRSDAKVSPWTIKGELAKLKSLFGKWLCVELGLLTANPFAHVKPPKCDDPDVRIVTADETAALFAWLGNRWNHWQLPLVYLEVAALLGWRATETASIREEDLLADGFVRVTAENCKTRRHKYGWLPPDLFADLKACSAGGFAFGRFPDDLRRLHILWRRRPSDAARVMDYSPHRFVQWFQDELTSFHESREQGDSKPERFSLHDFRRTAITGLQMSGVSEKETSTMVGATPEVIRKHYEKLDAMTIAKRAIERRLSANDPAALGFARPLRAERASPLAGQKTSPQTECA
jgi:hypothetical protein